MSSEALERAMVRLRTCAMLGRSVAGEVTMLTSATLDAEHCAALLAEVARLEQERDEARDRPMYGPEGRWAELRAERDAALADLAAARAREQRLRSALGDIAGRHPHANPGEHPAVDIARAALAVEPAAGKQLGDAAKRAITEHGAVLDGLADHFAGQSVSASAAADEPGEQ